MKTKSFLKWAGGKYKLVEEIKKVFNKAPSGKRLIEPFVGSGSVFLNLTDVNGDRYENYLVSDINKDLINLFEMVKKDFSGDFRKSCKELFIPSNNIEATYYDLRKEFNQLDNLDPKDIPRRSSLFIYLNRHTYNGLCRYNSKGGFNVPFGRYKTIYFPEDELKAFHIRAQNAEFKHQSFDKTMEEAKSGDVIYCDPPYAPLTKTASFTSYTTEAFGNDEQALLAEYARKKAAEGIPIVISNHFTEDVKKWYIGDNDVEVVNMDESDLIQVQRNIAGNGESRQKVFEVLALFLKKNA